MVVPWIAEKETNTITLLGELPDFSHYPDRGFGLDGVIGSQESYAKTANPPGGRVILCISRLHSTWDDVYWATTVSISGLVVKLENSSFSSQGGEFGPLRPWQKKMLETKLAALPTENAYPPAKDLAIVGYQVGNHWIVRTCRQEDLVPLETWLTYECWDPRLPENVAFAKAEINISGSRTPWLCPFQKRR
jgi:hypothetical protein